MKQNIARQHQPDAEEISIRAINGPVREPHLTFIQSPVKRVDPTWQRALGAVKNPFLLFGVVWIGLFLMLLRTL